MKPNKPTIILTIALLFLAVSLLITNKMHNNRLKRQATIETAKKDFALKQFDGNSASYDSVNVSIDTLLFYKKDSFIGKSIIVTE